MAPLRTLAALVLGASAVSAFAPASPLAAKSVAPVVRYGFFRLKEFTENVFPNWFPLFRAC